MTNNPTAKHVRLRPRVLARARASGLTHCPGFTDHSGVHHPCGRELRWDHDRTDPASAEVDHIIERRYGGTDDLDNYRVLCLGCNRGARNRKTSIPIPGPDQFPTIANW